MALRARFFLDAWEGFLAHFEYSVSQYCISREARDISRYPIDGLISLIYVYRDHIANVLPLLPWLHSSEACEHTFGDARLIVEDFTMLDFYYMVPKLKISMREAVLRGQSSDAKATASGYCHTYFDTKGIDIMELSRFPSDIAVERAASDAYGEAESLLGLLGVNLSQLNRLPGGTHTTFLPPISAWLSDYRDDKSLCDSDEDEDDPSLSELIKMAERESMSTQLEDETLKLTFAALSLQADKMTRL